MGPAFKVQADICRRMPIVRIWNWHREPDRQSVPRGSVRNAYCPLVHDDSESLNSGEVSDPLPTPLVHRPVLVINGTPLVIKFFLRSCYTFSQKWPFFSKMHIIRTFHLLIQGYNNEGMVKMGV